MTTETINKTTGAEKPPRKLFLKHIVRKIFLEDWLMKLIALAITIGLWLGVTGLSTPTTKRLTVQLAPYVSNSAEITNTPISEVDIVVSGDAGKLRQLTSAGVVASLDLSSLLPGDRIVSLSPENVSVAPLPEGVKLTDVQPSRIAIKIEAVDEFEVPVKADLEGQLAEGYEIYSETVLPQRVRVRGPLSFMSSLDYISTDKISVAGKSSDFTARQVPLGVSNPKATVFNTVVDVIIRIGEKRIERSFMVPVSGQTPGKKASVTLYGPKTLLTALKVGDLKVEIMKSDTGIDTPQAVLPAEYQDVVEIKKLKLNP